MKALRTMGQVIDALGGKKATASITGDFEQNVNNWLTRGRFPPTKYLIMTKALARRDLCASPTLWGMRR